MHFFIIFDDMIKNHFYFLYLNWLENSNGIILYDFAQFSKFFPSEKSQIKSTADS